MALALQDGEREWIARVIADLADDDLKLVYADWLEERGDKRARFLRRYAAAARTMKSEDFPSTRGMPAEWLELIGFRLMEKIAAEVEDQIAGLKAAVLPVAR